jgi:hypothetical protein
MIPTIGQMIIGFILPFALAFVSIPLESFVLSTRTVLGIVVSAGMRSFAFLLRLVGNAGYYTARLVVNLYDLLIFPSIWLEGVIVGSRTKSNDASEIRLFEDSAVAEEAVDNFTGAVDYKEHQE